MKKYILLFLFISIVNSYAGPPKNKNQNAERMIGNFNNWLSKNGHTQYLEINKNYNGCEDCNDKSWSTACFEKNGKPKKQCVINGDTTYDGGYNWKKKYKNNLDINVYTDRGTEIPHKARPNDDTLLF